MRRAQRQWSRARAVLDPNVLVSALTSPSAARPLRCVFAWEQEHFELVASPNLPAELGDVLARPKFRKWVSQSRADEFIQGLRDAADLTDDPPPRTGSTPDPDDDYLLALAQAAKADCVVSGDSDLLDLTDPRPQVLTPRAFLGRIEARRAR